jgi:ATP-dependent helicase HrpB
MLELPIDAHMPAIVAALRARPNLVLVAEPGAGKTTRLPRALLEAGFAESGEILVLEPRRIATRMAARRVAWELGEEVGGRIGYQVRFEQASSARTRVRFLTEGILTRRLVDDPQLRGVSTVVLDEFHERHLHADLGLALLRKLQNSSRPELRIVVMSATLAAAPLAKFLDAPVIEVPGRPYPVRIEYAEPASAEQRLEQRVAAALRRLLRDGLSGDVLVFLPGAAEIRRAQEACQPIAREAGLEIALLHGDLPAKDQDRAIERSARRKLILSTNVAETSLTIEGVTVVIDSGLARVAGHSPFSGLPTLSTAPISRSSATQRAGRAGRTGPGLCVRLYSKHDHDTRPEHAAPEIAREDLADTLLASVASGLALANADWFEPPPTAAWQAARELLQGLGALDAADRLSARGRVMADKPLHPRLSRLVLEAQARGAGASGCLLAALLGERDVLLSARSRFDGGRQHSHDSGRSDLVHRFELIESLGDDLNPSRLRAHDLDAGAVSASLRMRDRLLRLFDDAFDDRALNDLQLEEALLMATCAAFFDRVAKRRSARGELVFARGGSASVAETSVVRDAEYVVVVDAREQKGRGVSAYLISAIEPEWLLELFPERVRDQTVLSFDRKTERVEAVQTLAYEGLVLDQVSRADVTGPEVTQLLVDVAKERGLAELFDVDAVATLRERTLFAASIDPTLQALPEDVMLNALRHAAEGKKSLSELRALPLFDYVRAELAPNLAAKLSSLAPESVELPSGRRLRVHYQRDKPPFVESRLQDFFGMKEGPKFGNRPVVLHLLAPNQRAVQVTTDLAGFWQKHYPEVRRELMRRYPRHAWPDDPANAVPPSKPARRS